MPNLLDELDERSSQIRFETIDFSAGELVRLQGPRDCDPASVSENVPLDSGAAKSIDRIDASGFASSPNRSIST